MKDVLKAVGQIIVVLLMLPLLIGVLKAFNQQFTAIATVKQMALIRGGLIFLFLYLFIYDFKEFQDFTLSAMSKVFGFTGSLSGVVGYVIPVYAILTIVIHLLLVVTEKVAGFEGVILSFLGFFLLMHVVLSARNLYQSDTSLLKSGYFFMVGFLVIALCLVFAFLLNWLISEFSSWSFCKNAYNLAKTNYLSVWQFLFVDAGK